MRDLRLRWVGHRLTGSATIEVDATDLHTAEHAAAHAHEAIGNMDDFTVAAATHGHHH